MRVLQNELFWCPCGFPPVQRGTWQVSREQLLIVRAVAVLWRVCLFDLQSFSLSLSPVLRFSKGEPELFEFGLTN